MTYKVEILNRNSDDFKVECEQHHLRSVKITYTPTGNHVFVQQYDKESFDDLFNLAVKHVTAVF